MALYYNFLELSLFFIIDSSNEISILNQNMYYDVYPHWCNIGYVLWCSSNEQYTIILWNACQPLEKPSLISIRYLVIKMIDYIPIHLLQCDSLSSYISTK